MGYAQFLMFARRVLGTRSHSKSRSRLVATPSTCHADPGDDRQSGNRAAIHSALTGERIRSYRLIGLDGLVLRASSSAGTCGWVGLR